MKDYYQILGVPPNATADEIKRVFRKLAFKYHPDKNPGNAHAEAHFKEILEAYAIVSNERSRAAYDEERWLSGRGKKTNYREIITPQWLLKVSKELNASLAQMDTHRMSQAALRAYILLILSDSHLGILETEKEEAINEMIVRELLKAARLLEIHYTPDIATRLELLARNNKLLLADVQAQFREHGKQARFESLLPFIVIAVTLALCIFMYLFAG